MESDRFSPRKKSKEIHETNKTLNKIQFPMFTAESESYDWTQPLAEETHSVMMKYLSTVFL